MKTKKIIIRGVEFTVRADEKSAEIEKTEKRIIQKSWNNNTLD